MKPKFIACQHPKASVSPEPKTFRRMAKDKWWGQRKMGVASNGVRSQVHLDSKGVVAHYNRQGQLRTRSFSYNITESLSSLLPSMGNGQTVIDGEWVSQLDKLFIFDVLKFQDDLLKKLTYAERYEFLLALGEKIPVDHPHIEILRVIKSADTMIKEWESLIGDPYCEGMVFRSPESKGWNDSSIVRCRFNGAFKGR